MPEEKAKERLEDIDTDEVSLVDRAANKKQFLVVKNYGGENMTDEKKQQPMDDVEATEVIETEKVEDNPEATAEPTDTAGADDTGSDTDSTEKEVEKQANVENMFKQIMTSLGNISKMVQGMMRQKAVKQPTAKAEDGAKKDAKTDAFDAFDDLVKEVEKAGAKISKTRLAKVVAAHKQLTDLLKDLGALESEKGGDYDKKVKKDAEETTTEETATEETTDDNEANIAEVVKSLGEVAGQVKELSGAIESIQGKSAQSQQPGGDTTEEPVEKAQKFWGNVI